MVDVAPTILDLIGLESETVAMEGKSLVGLIEGDSEPPRAAFMSAIDFGMVRTKAWKYRTFQRGGAREELFRIGQDPLERSDAAASHPEVLTRMRQQYSDFVATLERRGGSMPAAGDAPPAMDDATREQLEALGYTE